MVFIGFWAHMTKEGKKGMKLAWGETMSKVNTYLLHCMRATK